MWNHKKLSQWYFQDRRGWADDARTSFNELKKIYDEVFGVPTKYTEGRDGSIVADYNPVGRPGAATIQYTPQSLEKSARRQRADVSLFVVQNVSGPLNIGSLDMREIWQRSEAICTSNGLRVLKPQNKQTAA